MVSTQELSGPALDWAIAKAEGKHLVRRHARFLELANHYRMSPEKMKYFTKELPPDEWTWLNSIGSMEQIELSSTNSEKAWTLLNEGHISLRAPTDGALPSEGESKLAWIAQTAQNVTMHGPTASIALWRCYVALKLGNEVDIPTDLLPSKSNVTELSEYALGKEIAQLTDPAQSAETVTRSKIRTLG